MPDGDRAVATPRVGGPGLDGSVRAGAGETEERTDDPCCGGNVGESIEGGFQCPQQLDPAGIVEADGAHHAVENFEVVGERLGRRIDDDEFGATESIDRRVAGGVERARATRAGTMGTRGSRLLRATA